MTNKTQHEDEREDTQTQNNKRRKNNDSGITTPAKDFDDFESILNKTMVSQTSPNNSVTETSTQKEVSLKKGEKNNIVIYKYSDQGPYVVFLDTLKIPVKSNGIEDVKIGKLMKFKKLSNFIIDIKKCGKHRMKITFNNREKANSLINDVNLITENLKAFIPLQFIQRIGIVKDVDSEISEEELLTNTTCKDNIKIQDICRFVKIKKGEHNEEIKTPLRTIKIIFRGQQLPDEVEIYGVKRKINQYLFTVTQCYQCYKFGHAKKSCKNLKKNCKNCGAEKHTEKDEDCREAPKCVNCHMNHNSTNKQCREFVRQSAIKKIMSLDNLSYWEANEKFPKVENFFNILEHAEEFPELPELFKNKNKNVNQELKKTYNMYHWYKEKSQRQPKEWNNKPHFNLPNENINIPNVVITNNPHRTEDYEKLVTEVNVIQTKLNSYLSDKETQSANPGVLDGLLIDIGVYLKRSEEIFSENFNSEQTASQK